MPVTPGLLNSEILASSNTVNNDHCTSGSCMTLEPWSPGQVATVAPKFNLIHSYDLRVRVTGTGTILWFLIDRNLNELNSYHHDDVTNVGNNVAYEFMTVSDSHTWFHNMNSISVNSSHCISKNGECIILRFLHMTFMFTYLAYFCIFFAYSAQKPETFLKVQNRTRFTCYSCMAVFFWLAQRAKKSDTNHLPLASAYWQWLMIIIGCQCKSSYLWIHSRIHCNEFMIIKSYLNNLT